MGKKYIPTKRGNLIIKLVGREFKLRPNFLACEEFELRSDVGVYEALVGIQHNRVNLKLVACVIHAAIVGANPGREDKIPSLREIQSMVFDEGIANVIPTALQVLTLMLSGAKAAEEIMSDDAGKSASEPKSNIENPESM